MDAWLLVTGQTQIAGTNQILLSHQQQVSVLRLPSDPHIL